MIDTLLMTEARQLIEFYDGNGWNWKCALSFIMTRGWFGPSYSVYDRNTHFASRRHRATRCNEEAKP